MQFLTFAALVTLATATAPPNKGMLFEEFIKTYGRDYETEFERGYRFRIFSENVDKIYASNAMNKSYKLGITRNADRTFNEWKSDYLNGFKPELSAQKDRPRFSAPSGFKEAESVDWVAKGGVTSVKNQGTCGSCWTFSTVGALEGAMFVAGRPMTELSMQHILACDKGGNGCGGGLMDQAFDWVAQNGLPSLKSEPYLCQDGNAAQCRDMTCSACSKRTGELCVLSGTCKKVPGSVCNKDGFIHHCECPSDQCFSDGACGTAPKPDLVLEVGDVVKHTDVDPTEDALEAAVAQQPVSVAIEADQAVFQHYTSGILTNDACGSTLDHGVLAVGYGEDNGQKYWKVKNSWGTTFAEDGYIRIAKGKASDGGECGIRKKASFPTVKKASNDVIV